MKIIFLFKQVLVRAAKILICD